MQAIQLGGWGASSVVDAKSACGLGPQLATERARVLWSEAREVLLEGSPLYPSSVGVASDHGQVEQTRVIDVLPDAGAKLHVLASSSSFAVGTVVAVQVDGDRRRRLAATHAACVLVRSELARRELAVVSYEIAAGMAWIELAGGPCELDLSQLARRAGTLVARPAGDSTLSVRCGGVELETVYAPLARDASALVGAEARTVAALQGGGSALEIALPDGRGRWWT